MIDQQPDARGRLIRIGIATGCVLLSIFVVVDHVALSNLRREMAARTHDTEIDHRIAGLEQRVEAIERQPSSVSQASFAASQQTLNDRLAKVELIVDGSARMNDIAPLQDRLRTLDARVSKALRTLAPSRQAIAPPAETDPPFTVLGIELRGGERLLTLLPAGSHSLAEVRLLRVGETHGAWRLEALHGNTAEFRINGRLQRIVAP